MRVMVTGAGGVLGSYVVSRLLELGFRVTAVSSQPADHVRTRVTKRGGTRNPRVAELSVVSTREVLSQDWDGGYAAVVHCAFPRRGDGAQLAEWFESHKSLCEKAAAESVRVFLNVSSQSVYAPDREGKAAERDPVSCYDRYSTAKYAAEVIAGAVVPAAALVNVRLASLIGPDYP